MTVDAESATIFQIMAQVWVGAPWFYMIGLESSSPLPANLACVIISLKYLLSPFSVLDGPIFIAVSFQIGTGLQPPIGFDPRGAFWIIQCGAFTTATNLFSTLSLSKAHSAVSTN